MTTTTPTTTTPTVDQIESNVRSYSRSFPVTFRRALGAKMWDTDGNEYLDFLAGAGTLNYGHNNPVIREAVIAHIESEAVVHGLDMMTETKAKFLQTFHELILAPRDLDYKVQFCGPTGTNAVEAALKLARKVTGRAGVISFTNGYHGMTLGALAVTGNFYHKESIPGTEGSNATFMPYNHYMEDSIDTLALLRQYLTDNSSGVALPAAIIVETVQGEGGINVASAKWVRGLRELCTEFSVLMIVDDIQMGCGRTGGFFSFEEADITPDIVVLSKSIGAYGLPMALVLLKPELDQWTPAQHNGTFRGHNLAFAAATKALEHFWSGSEFTQSIRHKSQILNEELQKLAAAYPQADFEVRGRGLAYGIEAKAMPELASQIRQACFAQKLIVETCGSDDQVLKFLPALTISEAELRRGMTILSTVLKRLLASEAATHEATQMKKGA